MFNFFKRSKSQKSKQKQDRTQQADAAKPAALGACVANSAETPPPSPPSPTMQLDQDAAVGPPSCSGNGGEGESVKNKQHSPPTATSILTSPNDIIRENGRSFGLEDDGVIEFVDEGDDDDDDEDAAINECEDPRRRQRGEQSTSINHNANLLESTMAKGKNKRRYQGGKNVQQQQQQHHQGQKQKENHLLELKQACNVTAEKINLEGETKQPVTVVTANGVTQSAENVSNVHESDDSKVNQQHNSKQEEPKMKIVSQNTDQPCVPTAGDVNGKNAEDHEDKNSIVPRSETVNNKPSLTEDRETGDAGVSENPTTLQTVTSPIPLTQTDTTLDADVAGGNELLNSTASSVAQPCPTAELHSSTNAKSHEIKDGPREPSASSETVTSEHVTSSNEEMGQQPSKPSEPLNNNCRRSSTPNRQPPSPPPTLIIQQTLPLQQPAKIEDAARDDISDDRDVFYEAKESLSPGTPAAASLDHETEPPLPLQADIPATKEASPLKAIIVSPNQSEPRASPKKRVVFSEQLIIEGKPLQEFDLCNSASSSANSSTESLPNALNLEAPSYEEHLVQNSAPNSLVNNNNHKNSVNIVLCVGNDPPHAFNSDNNTGISPSVPPPLIITPKPNLIEFKYNSSDDSAILQNGHKQAAEKEESKRRSQSLPILGSKVGCAEDTISLPDVVQPSDKAVKPFNTVDKLNSEM